MIQPNHIMRLKGYRNWHGQERWDCQIDDASTGEIIALASACASADEAREKAEQSALLTAQPEPGTEGE